MGIFGWSYPPGAALDPYAPYNQQEGPCEVCGQFVDDCICPECPECHTHGDTHCYDIGHYNERTACKVQLQRSEAQIIGARLRDEAMADALRIEQEYWNDMQMRQTDET